MGPSPGSTRVPPSEAGQPVGWGWDIRPGSTAGPRGTHFDHGVFKPRELKPSSAPGPPTSPGGPGAEGRPAGQSPPVPCSTSGAPGQGLLPTAFARRPLSAGRGGAKAARRELRGRCWQKTPNEQLLPNASQPDNVGPPTPPSMSKMTARESPQTGLAESAGSEVRPPGRAQDHPRHTGSGLAVCSSLPHRKARDTGLTPPSGKGRRGAPPRGDGTAGTSSHPSSGVTAGPCYGLI